MILAIATDVVNSSLAREDYVYTIGGRIRSHLRTSIHYRMSYKVIFKSISNFCTVVEDSGF